MHDSSDGVPDPRLQAHEQKSDWLIYVVDSGQSLHFELIFEAARNLGYVTPETRVDHVNFGVVLGEDGGRIKSRSGETITLKSLLDEGTATLFHRFGTFLAAFISHVRTFTPSMHACSELVHYCACIAPCATAVRGGHAHRVLIGACNPMLCPVSRLQV